jgi:hypothetical protein
MAGLPEKIGASIVLFYQAENNHNPTPGRARTGIKSGNQVRAGLVILLTANPEVKAMAFEPEHKKISDGKLILRALRRDLKFRQNLALVSPALQSRRQLLLVHFQWKNHRLFESIN